MKRKFISNLNPTTILLWILVLASLLRVAVAVMLGSSVEPLPGIADQETYHTLAQRVLQGHGFSFGIPWWPATRAGEPTAHWSYLYTFYLSGVYALAGVTPIAARLLQALIVGVAQPLLAFKLGERLFGTRAGLWSAGLTAIYAYFIYYAAALMTEAFFITALMATFYLAIQITDLQPIPQETITRRLWIYSLALGLFLGIAILLRQLIVLFVPFLFLWLAVVLRPKVGIKRAIAGLSIAGIVIVLMILPFTINNYHRFGTFVLLNTNAGFAFFWANHPIYGIHFQPILSAETASYGELIPRSLRHLNEAELDKALLKLGMGFVIEDPRRYFLLSLSRIPAYFLFWPTPGSSLPSNVLRVMSFGITLPFMLYGVTKGICAQRGFRDLLISPMGLLLSFAIVYAGIHILSWSLVRYRLPVDAILIPFAGYAIHELISNNLSGATLFHRYAGD
jgi:4-amino-4-deoxy-L-arabinose transferase-like glycosyltransferase